MSHRILLSSIPTVATSLTLFPLILTSLLELQNADEAVAAQSAGVLDYKGKLQVALTDQDKLRREVEQAQLDIASKVI